MLGVLIKVLKVFLKFLKIVNFFDCNTILVYFKLYYFGKVLSSYLMLATMENNKILLCYLFCWQSHVTQSGILFELCCRQYQQSLSL